MRGTLFLPVEYYFGAVSFRRWRVSYKRERRPEVLLDAHGSQYEGQRTKAFFYLGSSAEGKVREHVPPASLTFNFISYKDVRRHSHCLSNEKMHLEFCTNSL